MLKEASFTPKHKSYFDIDILSTFFNALLIYQEIVGRPTATINVRYYFRVERLDLAICGWLFCLAWCFSALCTWTFLREQPECLQLKKTSPQSRNCPGSFIFFPIVQSDNFSGGPSVVVTTSRNNVKEKLLVTADGRPHTDLFHCVEYISLCRIYYSLTILYYFV